MRCNKLCIQINVAVKLHDIFLMEFDHWALTLFHFFTYPITLSLFIGALNWCGKQLFFMAVICSSRSLVSHSFCCCCFVVAHKTFISFLVKKQKKTFYSAVESRSIHKKAQGKSTVSKFMSGLFLIEQRPAVYDVDRNFGHVFFRNLSQFDQTGSEQVFDARQRDAREEGENNRLPRKPVKSFGFLWKFMISNHLKGNLFSKKEITEFFEEKV